MDQRDWQRSEAQSIHDGVADGRAHDIEGAWKNIDERGSRHAELFRHTAGQRSAFCGAVKGADSCFRGRAVAPAGSASRHWRQGRSVQSFVSEAVRHCAKDVPSGRHSLYLIYSDCLSANGIRRFISARSSDLGRIVRERGITVRYPRLSLRCMTSATSSMGYRNLPAIRRAWRGRAWCVPWERATSTMRSACLVCWNETRGKAAAPTPSQTSPRRRSPCASRSRTRTDRKNWSTRPVQGLGPCDPRSSLSCESAVVIRRSLRSRRGSTASGMDLRRDDEGSLYRGDMQPAAIRLWLRVACRAPAPRRRYRADTPAPHCRGTACAARSPACRRRSP